MAVQNTAKLERIVEAVRQELEGDAAIEFMQRNGIAITVAGIARHLRKMGGRGRIREFLHQGLSNEEILERCVAYIVDPNAEPLLEGQHELFPASYRTAPEEDVPLYSTRKLSITIPSDLYEAVRLAARAERKSRNQLIVDLLTTALSQSPEQAQQEFDDV